MKNFMTTNWKPRRNGLLPTNMQSFKTNPRKKQKM